ncbi:MAG: DUF1559 domain-containing protein [Planctomycetes bacterium]|nr:DUF1559 domain-containing protein [Planctomycetota bacterium]
MNEFGIALLWCAVQVTALSLAAGICYLVARRFSPSAGSLVTLTSLMVVIALSVLAFSPWPQWTPLFTATDQANSASTETAQADDSSEDGIERTSASENGSGTDQTEAMVNPESRLTEYHAEDEPAFGALFWEAFKNELRTHPAEAGKPQPWRWPALLGMLVLVGISVGAVRLVLGWAAVRSYRRRSRPVRDPQLLELADVICAELSFTKPIEMRHSTELVTAATLGWRRPLILLPSEWSRWNEQERRAVLAHEIAHISRNDFLAWICAQVGVVLHFYHPLVHWLAGRLRLEQELAADATAAALSGGQQRYLQTLAAMALRQADRPVAWPARTFLPTRRTFLRRIEMLRDTKQLAVTTLSRGTRVATIGLLVLAGIAVAGLRNPGSTLTQSAQAERTLRHAVEQQSTTASVTKPFDLSWVPKNSVAVYAVRPEKIFSLPGFEAIVKVFDEDIELKKELGMTVRNLEQVVLAMVQIPRTTRQDVGFILKVSKPTNFKKFGMRWIRATDEEHAKSQKYKGVTYYRNSSASVRSSPSRCYFIPDGKTIVISENEEVIKQYIDAEKNGAANAAWADVWKEVETSQAAGLMNIESLQAELKQAMQQAPANHPLMAMMPIYEKSKTIAFGVDLDKQLNVRVIAACGSKEDAEEVKKTVDAALTLGKNMLAGFRQQLVNRPPLFQEKALVELYLGLGETFLKNAKVEQKESTVRLTSFAAGDAAAKLVTALLPAVTQAREAARRTMAKNNLKQITLAFHNYHDTFKHFPAAAVIGPNNKTPHSWRVALLPYLAQQELHRQYNLNEPWDSPNNKNVLAKMPDVFRDPHMDGKSTSSAYFVLTGDATVFDGEEGTSFRDIRDGTSNTILVVEAKRNIPWTKPADIPYDADPKKDFPKLGGFYKGGFHVLFCDGSVRFISEDIDVTLLRALFTIDGGEVVSRDDF